MNDMTELFGSEPIHTYSMADALKDGTLIAAGDLAKDLFRWPVVLTSAAWSDAVEWSDEDSRRTGSYGQSETGRLWDVLWMTSIAVRLAPKGTGLGDELKVHMARVSRDPEHVGGPDELEAEDIELKATIAVDDAGGPVLVISLPDED